jgi:hypothetical protein
MTNSLLKYDKNGKLRITDNSRSYIIRNDNNKYYYMKNKERITCTAKVNKYKKGGLNIRDNVIFMKFNVWYIEGYNFDDSPIIGNQRYIVDAVIQIDPLNNNNRNLVIIDRTTNNQVIGVWRFDGPDAGNNANLTEDEWETHLIQSFNDTDYYAEKIPIKDW